MNRRLNQDAVEIFCTNFSSYLEMRDPGKIEWKGTVKWKEKYNEEFVPWPKKWQNNIILKNSRYTLEILQCVASDKKKEQRELASAVLNFYSPSPIEKICDCQLIARVLLEKGLIDNARVDDLTKNVKDSVKDWLERAEKNAREILGEEAASSEIVSTERRKPHQDPVQTFCANFSSGPEIRDPSKIELKGKEKRISRLKISEDILNNLACICSDEKREQRGLASEVLNSYSPSLIEKICDCRLIAKFLLEKGLFDNVHVNDLSKNVRDSVKDWLERAKEIAKQTLLVGFVSYGCFVCWGTISGRKEIIQESQQKRNVEEKERIKAWELFTQEPLLFDVRSSKHDGVGFRGTPKQWEAYLDALPCAKCKKHHSQCKCD